MLTNNAGLPLHLAAWLASNFGYDLTHDPNVISATSILRPMKSLLLTRRMTESSDIADVSRDVMDNAASTIGSSVHGTVEMIWSDPKYWKPALAMVGYPENVLDRIVVNPTKDQLKPGVIPVYCELRGEKKVHDITISGKFDFVVDGAVRDIKTTSTFSYVKGNNANNYIWQGSIYRWLFPEIITEDFMYIDFVFTDFSPVKAQSDPAYPNNRIESKKYPLHSLADTELYLEQRVMQYLELLDVTQEQMPDCKPKELWQDPSTWAYYTNPENKRASKVFDNQLDAHHYQSEKGKGVVVERPGEPVFCRYCEARPICLQAQNYIEQGLLKV